MSTLMKISSLLLLIFSCHVSAQIVPDYIGWVKYMCEQGYPDLPRDRELACEEYTELMQWSKMNPPRYPFKSIGFVYNAPYKTQLLINNKQQVLLRYSSHLPNDNQARLEIIDGKHTSSFIFPMPSNPEEPQNEFINIEKTSNAFILFTQKRLVTIGVNKPRSYWKKYYYLCDRNSAAIISIFTLPLGDNFYQQYPKISITKRNGIILFKIKILDDDKKNSYTNFFYKFKLDNSDRGIDCIDSAGKDGCMGVETLKKIPG